MSEHHIYFIEQQVNQSYKPVKIGFSSNPHKRMEELQVGSPHRLKLGTTIAMPTIEDARKMERIMHDLVAARFKRLSGEWFLIYGSWRKFIKQSFKIFEGMDGGANP